MTNLSVHVTMATGARVPFMQHWTEARMKPVAAPILATAGPDASQTSGPRSMPTPAGCAINEIGSAVDEVRSALGALLHEVGVDSRRVRGSARDLGVNRGLIWRVSRVINDDDLASSAQHIPGLPSIDRLINACVERGANVSTGERVRDGVRHFEHAVSRSSGDRRSAAVLLASESVDSGAKQLAIARRQFYEGARAIWGAHGALGLCAHFLAPSTERPGYADNAYVRSIVGLRRLRSIPWTLSYQRVYDSSGRSDSGEPPDVRLTSIDPNGPLLRAYCSPHDLPVDVVERDGLQRYVLEAGPIGNAGRINSAVGMRAVGVHPTPSRPEQGPATSMMIIDTPLEEQIFDLCVHRDLEPASLPLVGLCDRLTTPHSYDKDELKRETLPLTESLRPLGVGLRRAIVPNAPWYTDMLSHVYETLGWRSDDFLIYRFQMRYPPVATVLMIQTDLPHPHGATP